MKIHLNGWQLKMLTVALVLLFLISIAPLAAAKSDKGDKEKPQTPRENKGNEISDNSSKDHGPKEDKHGPNVPDQDNQVPDGENYITPPTDNQADENSVSEEPPAGPFPGDNQDNQQQSPIENDQTVEDPQPNPETPAGVDQPDEVHVEEPQPFSGGGQVNETLHEEVKVQSVSSQDDDLRVDNQHPHDKENDQQTENLIGVEVADSSEVSSPSDQTPELTQGEGVSGFQTEQNMVPEVSQSVQVLPSSVSRGLSLAMAVIGVFWILKFLETWNFGPRLFPTSFGYSPGFRISRLDPRQVGSVILSMRTQAMFSKFLRTVQSSR